MGGGEADLQRIFLEGKLSRYFGGDEYDLGRVDDAVDSADMAVCFDADTYCLFWGAEIAQYRQVFLS